jgi:hypothetical protein
MQADEVRPQRNKLGKEEKRKIGWFWRIMLGGAALLVVAAAGISAWIIPIEKDFARSSRTEAEIDRTFPSADTFTPPLDGSIQADRLRAFLAVRRRLAPLGARLTQHRRGMQRMEVYKKEDDVRAKEFIVDVGAAMRGFAPLLRDLAAYVEQRNAALLENRMGLGEYTWLYVVCYVGELGERPSKVIPNGSKPDLFQERVYPQLREMIRRRVELAESAMKKKAHDDGESADIQAWRDELEALQTDDKRLPFQDGLPMGLKRSLAPLRAELAALSCPASAEPDLTRTVRRGLTYDHR